jgi:2,4-dienoyl-CoA reductase-like NADH-dependent reductase (Old Yellow Enzyme family)
MTSVNDPLLLPSGQVLPTRIMKAAMSGALGDKANAPDKRLQRLYTMWSQGGYELLITGSVMIDCTQLGEPGNVVIEDDRDLATLTRWAKSTHDAGAPIWVQLNHPGRQSNLLALGHTPVAPSAVALNLPRAPTPREPVLVANGDNDLMVASSNSADMARRMPNARLTIYPNSGHGGVFQHHQTFVPEVLDFLAD